MRGIYSLLLVFAFASVLLGVLLRFSSVEQANRAALWYMRVKSWEYVRRDIELSVRRALEYAARDCYPPTTECVNKSAQAWLERLKLAWASEGFQISLDPSKVTSYIIFDSITHAYLVRVSLTAPVEGNIGTVRLYIPAGFFVEVIQ